MPNAAEKHITFGKHKHMLKKDRQARTAAARLARNLSQTTTSLNTALPDNPGSDADDNKENDGIDTSGPSRYAQKQNKRANILKGQVDSFFRKKAKYWHTETEESRETIVNLRKSLKQTETKIDEKEKEIMAKKIEIERREKEKRNTEKKGSRDLKEKDEKIEELRREVEQRRVQVEEVEEKPADVYKWLSTPDTCIESKDFAYTQPPQTALPVHSMIKLMRNGLSS
ncbi:hypothetical protein F5876DRAFT_73496 [Lentinula aff. lateritia]|uniref:Uncharacterized protein n=1 Tax=Lentinula aff. lateritia TaxID=2804960 RepID=A0ACC1UA79_9AGAR|nr:hypothetical protein F5876DRAFT_73496 [Lentinula aff. lateritia]